MPNPSTIYRAACSAAIAEHNRALAELSGNKCKGDELATARRGVEQAYISATSAALIAYDKTRE